MATPRSTTWKGRTTEQRRAERREQLLDAALDLLGTEGWAGTSVRSVCRRAALSSRYFYESFADLDALLLAVFDRAFASSVEEILTAIEAAPRDLRARSRAAVETAVSTLTDDPRKARVLFVEGMGNDQLMRRRQQMITTLVRHTGVQTRTLGELPSAASGLADATATMLMGGFAELLLAWLGGGLEHTREQLIDDMTELLIANVEAASRIAQQRERDGA